jgi:hypothetical protein
MRSPPAISASTNPEKAFSSEEDIPGTLYFSTGTGTNIMNWVSADLGRKEQPTQSNVNVHSVLRIRIRDWVLFYLKDPG